MRSCATWITRREIWPLSVGVALATFTARWTGWGLGLIVALWLVRWLGRGRLTVRTPIDWAASLLVTMIPVTFYATTSPLVTFVQVSRLLAGLALVYGLANWARRPAHLSLAALGLVGVGLGLAFVVPFGMGSPSVGKLPLIPRGLHELWPRVGSDTINANMIAGALVMVLPFPLALLLEAGVSSPGAPSTLPSVAGAVPGFAAWMLDRRWIRRLWYGVALLSMLAALSLTLSRGAWIAGAVALFVVLVRHWRRLLWLIPIAFSTTGLLAWRGELLALLEALVSGGVVPTLERRIEIWSRALYMIRDFPFTGIGVGTFQQVADVLYPFFLAGPDAEIPHAHNLLLQVAVDLGLPGLVAFLSILVLAFWSALDNARSFAGEGDDALAAVAWAGVASLIGMLVHGIVDATTWIVGRGAFVPWAVIGMLVALRVGRKGHVEAER